MKFGDRVTATHYAAKRRSFPPKRRLGYGLAISGAHGDRVRHSWSTPHDLAELDVLVHGHETTGPYDTIVDVVRVPFEKAAEGLVVGATRRHAGSVFNIGYEEGNGWTSSGSCPVVCVAVDVGDGPPCIYDVHPDDVEPA